MAQHYHERYGWSILPAKGKKPHVRHWRRYQSEAPCTKELEDLFSIPGCTGLAVIAGPVSDDLTVRDWDKADAYQAWAAAQPDLAYNLPTVQTARGYHVLFRSPAVNRISVQIDGELRGRGVSLLPPSVHPSGMQYRWLVQPNKVIPTIDDLNGAGLAAVTYTSACNEFVGLDLELLPRTVGEAIARTLPTGPGQRNRRIFHFARALKQLCPDAPPAELRKVVADWHQQALPFIRTRDFATTMQDFIVAWQKVKSAPLSMPLVVEEAKEMATPAVALHYPCNVQLLVRVCAVLQRHWGDRPFFLGVGKAAEVMGINRMAAWRALQELQFDQILTQESIGTLKDKRASTWRYVLSNPRRGENCA